MMYVFSTNASSLGLVCSMPTSMMSLSSLPMAYILKSGHISPRVMAVIGAIISSLGIIIAGHLTSVIALGFCLTITGIGLSMGYLPSKVLLNDYFMDDFILMNSIGNLGSTVGALVVPVIIERSLQAYGFSGAMLILGGISLHAIVGSVTLRAKECPRKSTGIGKARKDSQETEEIPLINPNSDYQSVDMTVGEPDISVDHEATSTDISQYQDQIGEESPRQRLWHWIRHCIFVEEPLMSLSLPCLFLTSSILQSWFLFLVPRAEWRRIPSSTAVLLSSFGGGGGIIGRILCIVLLYFGVDFIVVFLIVGVISSTTFLIDPLLTSFPAMCATAFVQGMCLFSSSLGYGAFIKVAVSNENFTVASGISGLVVGLGGNIGSLLSGMIKDKTGSYTKVFLFLGFANCLTVILTIVFLAARRRRDHLSLQENL
ncbi:monocarboxylate transporter 12 [Strongylocentrotus purpuratus]|uniref:Uncharacterized protein n=1 Tax=Strongylocentrotus purpuratus TaxID=7668 RepID=A0A7M7GH33_STRPU|nr:monocarboxylate transporter 12 [Strongylocentrotus purpuratus]